MSWECSDPVRQGQRELQSWVYISTWSQGEGGLPGCVGVYGEAMAKENNSTCLKLCTKIDVVESGDITLLFT